ncbi:MAG: REP-associated tyrosine transposase [Casimicrobium sp.]
MPRSTPPQAAALRRGRVSMHGQAYHVITRCVEGTQPFANSTIAFVACRRLHRDAMTLDAKLYAWALMPDHLHLLVELGETLTLSSAIAQYKRGIASSVNEVRGTPGVSVWQAGFYDRALRKDDDLGAVAQYIVANPVNAKLVDDIGDYPWWNSLWF